MEIAKYFERISKKCDLSNKSSNEEASKKLRQLISFSLDNSSCSDVSVNNKDPFTEGLQSPECVSILMNCMPNLEKQFGHIFNMLEKSEDHQIKGEFQPTDFAKGVNFITQKFDQYEKDRREKDTIIATLQSELKSASMKVEDLEKKMDRQEQYSRGNCILIHGLKEQKNKSTDDRVLELFREELNEEILLVNLDRTHRIGKKRHSNSKPRPVIVKFARYNIREKVFKSKKRLKGKNISITENLAGYRMSVLKEAREKFSFKNVWTYNGWILYKDNNDGQKIKIYYEYNLFRGADGYH